jgi:DEAD/DEAH box helicase domain-containing protein
VSIRAIDEVQFSVVDAGAGNTLVDTVEEWRAYFCIHEGAIYMQQGVTYKVEHLDTVKHVARVRTSNVPYYTSTRDHTDVTLLGRLSSTLGSRAHYGRLNISQEVFGFKKIWKQNGGVFEVVDLSLPIVAYQTFGVWLDIPLDIKLQLDARGLDFLAGMHAANHAIIGVLPLFVKCERTDLGSECPSALQQRAKPMRCMVYDKRPGGTGIVAAAFKQLASILRAAIALCIDCPCVEGCPSCVYDLGCSQYNFVIDKAAAVLILQDALMARQL